MKTVVGRKRKLHPVGSTLLSLIALSVACASAAIAEDAALRAFPGEYVVTFPEYSSALDYGSVGRVRAARDFSVLGVNVIDQTESAAVLRAPKVAALSSENTQTERIAVAVDPDDTFCPDLVARGAVETCSPNYEVHASTTTPNDPSFGSLWGMNGEFGIGATRAWGLTTGSQDIVVAVIDTGVDYNHPDLRDNMWRNSGEIAGNNRDDDGNGIIDDVFGYNAQSGAEQPGNPFDDNMHGTHVAGTIGAVGGNGLGVVGVNHSVRIMALKFLDARGAGSLADAVKAIDYMTMMKRDRGVNIRVANNSWGGGGFSQALLNAITRAREAGIIFVAAAGNESNDNDANPSYPGGYEVANVVSVASIDRAGRLSSFSNFGTTAVDIAAPGSSILSTVPGGGYATLSGTSMATPHVSGALALLLAREPALDATAAINRLYESGRTLDSLSDAASGVALVRTRRTLDVGRMLYNETAPIPSQGGGEQSCGYDLSFSNIVDGGFDRASDGLQQTIQSDEGSFTQVRLPFPFPFFRSTLDSIYLSPNGIVHAKFPSKLDYQTGATAPTNTIAALHTDLTPTKPHHGVRVYASSDRVTISWVSEHYASQGGGDITARLTLYPSGVIESSTTFGSFGELAELRAKVLGDPFTGAPATAVVGAAGPTAAFVTTVNLSDAQRGLIASSGDVLNLGIRMVPNCNSNAPIPGDGGGGEGGGGGGDTNPNPAPPVRVDAMSLRQVSETTARDRSRMSPTLRIALRGVGTGTVPVFAAVNGRACDNAGSAQLVNGVANLTTNLPRSSVRLSMSSGSAQDNLRVRATRPRSRAGRLTSARIASICQRVIGGLASQ